MTTRSFLLLTIGFFSLTSQALTLDEYLNTVKQKNRNFNSIELSTQASKEKQRAQNLALSPLLTAGYSMATDKSQPSSIADERQLNELSLGVAQQFSTGTAVSLTAKTDDYNFKNDSTPALSKYSTGSLGVSLQQSLWKDSFGKATRLRRDRESATNQLETMALELKRRAILIEAETSFWDYAVALEDLKLKKENLERARKIENWTSSRVSNGISDRSDLMNAKALASLRQLELQSAQDELNTQEVRFRENLDMADLEKTPEIKANLFENRNYVNELKKQQNIMKIDSYISLLESKTKRLVSDEVNENLKPDLSFTGSYNTSSYDKDSSQALKDISKTDRPKTYIGLNLTWIFDTEAKRAQVSAANKEALAAQYTADKKRQEGLHAWAEHLRKYEVTQENVKTLEKIAQYQRERAKAEQDKFSKGRTITASVVTAETDSAEAEVRYLKAKSGLRKLEAATLLFTAVQE